QRPQHEGGQVPGGGALNQRSRTGRRNRRTAAGAAEHRGQHHARRTRGAAARATRGGSYRQVPGGTQEGGRLSLSEDTARSAGRTHFLELDTVSTFGGAVRMTQAGFFMSGTAQRSADSSLRCRG